MCVQNKPDPNWKQLIHIKFQKCNSLIKICEDNTANKWNGKVGLLCLVFSVVVFAFVSDLHLRTVTVSQIESLEREIIDLQSEFEFDRIDYLDTIRKQERHIMLLDAIIARIQPCLRRDCNYYNLDRIRTECKWNEEEGRWMLPKMVIDRTSLPSTGEISQMEWGGMWGWGGGVGVGVLFVWLCWWSERDIKPPLLSMYNHA